MQLLASNLFPANSQKLKSALKGSYASHSPLLFSAPVAIFVCRAPPRVWSRRKNVRPTSPPTNYGNDTFKCGSSNASPSSVFACSVVTVTQETKYWVLGDGCHSSYETGLGREDQEPHSPQQHIVQPSQQLWSCMINNCMVTL